MSRNSDPQQPPPNNLTLYRPRLRSTGSSQNEYPSVRRRQNSYSYTYDVPEYSPTDPRPDSRFRSYTSPPPPLSGHNNRHSAHYRNTYDSPPSSAELSPLTRIPAPQPPIVRPEYSMRSRASSYASTYTASSSSAAPSRRTSMVGGMAGWDESEEYHHRDGDEFDAGAGWDLDWERLKEERRAERRRKRREERIRKDAEPWRIGTGVEIGVVGLAIAAGLAARMGKDKKKFFS
jgi:hypothetical protein